MNSSLLFYAWGMGVLCGVCWVYSTAWRAAATVWVATLAVCHLFQITGDPWLLDAFGLTGLLLLAFGVVRGLVALIFDDTKEDGGETTLPTGSDGALRKRGRGQRSISWPSLFRGRLRRDRRAMDGEA